MIKRIEALVEEDSFGNCINKEEKLYTSIDVAHEDKDNQYLYIDSHYSTHSSSYFHKKQYYRYNTFYYKSIESVYDYKNYLVRETTKNVDGKITKEILHNYKFDELGNKVYESIRTKVDNEYKEKTIVVYIYDNHYTEYGELIRSIKTTEDGEIIFKKEYKYENNKLDKIDIYDYNNNLYETSQFYYSSDNNSYEEEVFSLGELSYYNQYCLVDEERYKRIMMSPTKGKYKWTINANKLKEGICRVDIFESILIVDVVVEIVEYLIANYNDKIKSVILSKYENINIEIFKEDLEKIYNIYYEKYRLMIKYC